MSLVIQGGKILDQKVIKAIEFILSKGDRVEIIPGPNGTVQIIRITRKTELDTRK